MKVAVVILNWNGLELLKEFLPGVVKHSTDLASVFVADNGSTDNSLDWLRQNFPEVGIIDNRENLGFAGGYNKALSSIKSEYYVLLNSDVEVGENWIQPIISYMDINPDVAACQPKILSYHSKDSFEHAGAAGGFIDKYGYPFCMGRVFDSVEKDEKQYDNIRDIFWASGACMFIRAENWRKAGGFDPDFFAHMEEIDLCWRLNSKGYRIVFIPDSVVYHVGGGTLNYDSPVKIFYNFRNNLYMLHKNLPAYKLRSLIFKRLILDGIAGARFILTLKFAAFRQVLNSHIAYYKNIKSLNRKRKDIVNANHYYPENLILDKSIVFQYYLNGKKTYRDIIGDSDDSGSKVE